MVWKIGYKDTLKNAKVQSSNPSLPSVQSQKITPRRLEDTTEKILYNVYMEFFIHFSTFTYKTIS